MTHLTIYAISRLDLQTLRGYREKANDPAHARKKVVDGEQVVEIFTSRPVSFKLADLNKILDVRETAVSNMVASGAGGTT